MPQPTPSSTAPASAAEKARQRKLLPSQEEAAARLQFAAEQGLGLTLLFGATGTGKSSLLHYLANQFRRQGLSTALISTTGTQPAEVLWQILGQWGANPSQTAAPVELLRKANDFVTGLACQQRRAVLLLDDLSAAPAETWQALQAWLSAASIASHITVIASAEAFSRSRLPRWWLERAELRAELEPLSDEQTEALIGELNAQADAPAKLAPAAVATLQKLTDGVPRRIEQLQRLVLLAAEGSSSTTIDAATIEQVFGELYVTPRG